MAVADNSKLGHILVNAQDRTLYLFEKDESDESYCNGNCAKLWPPYTTKGGPKAGKGAEASKLGTLKRDDGSTQVTYNGSPLYLYAGDKQPAKPTATTSTSSAPSGTRCARRRQGRGRQAGRWALRRRWQWW